MNNLDNPELLALLALHQRMPEKVWQDFPYDKKDEIIKWLRENGENHLAECLRDVEPRFIAVHIAGYKIGSKMALDKEKAILATLLGERK